MIVALTLATGTITLAIVIGITVIARALVDWLCDE